MSRNLACSNLPVAILKANLTQHLTNPGMRARQQAGGDSIVIQLCDSAVPEVLAR
jgi:hypothetical protein